MYRGTVPLIKSDVLKESLKKSSTPILLDVRSQKEYEVSKIPGARFIDYDTFKNKDVKSLPKDAEIVVYCAVGYRSERIGERLLKMGYENVKNLYGGIFDWKNQGYEIINSHSLPTDSVHTYNKNWSQWLYKGVKVYE